MLLIDFTDNSQHKIAKMAKEGPASQSFKAVETLLYRYLNNVPDIDKVVLEMWFDYSYSENVAYVQDKIERLRSEAREGPHDSPFDEKAARHHIIARELAELIITKVVGRLGSIFNKPD